MIVYEHRHNLIWRSSTRATIETAAALVAMLPITITGTVVAGGSVPALLAVDGGGAALCIAFIVLASWRHSRRLRAISRGERDRKVS